MNFNRNYWVHKSVIVGNFETNPLMVTLFVGVAYINIYR